MIPMRFLAPSALILCVCAAPASAQLPGVDLKVIPKIGAFAPLSDLTEEAAVHSLEPALALGLAVEVGVPVLPNFRLNMDYATGATLKREGTDVDAGDLGDVSIMHFTGDLVFKRRIALLSPYLLLGGGVKRYDFPDSVESFTADDETDWVGHVGVGLELSLPVVGVVVEVSDYISRFEALGDNTDRQIQNDIFVMLGARLGIL